MIMEKKEEEEDKASSIEENLSRQSYAYNPGCNPHHHFASDFRLDCPPATDSGRGRADSSEHHHTLQINRHHSLTHH